MRQRRCVSESSYNATASTNTPPASLPATQRITPLTAGIFGSSSETSQPGSSGHADRSLNPLPERLVMLAPNSPVGQRNSTSKLASMRAGRGVSSRPSSFPSNFIPPSIPYKEEAGPHGRPTAPAKDFDGMAVFQSAIGPTEARLNRPRSPSDERARLLRC